MVYFDFILPSTFILHHALPISASFNSASNKLFHLQINAFVKWHCHDMIFHSRKSLVTDIGSLSIWMFSAPFFSHFGYSLTIEWVVQIVNRIEINFSDFEICTFADTRSTLSNWFSSSISCTLNPISKHQFWYLIWDEHS